MGVDLICAHHGLGEKVCKQDVWAGLRCGFHLLLLNEGGGSYGTYYYEPPLELGQDQQQLHQVHDQELHHYQGQQGGDGGPGGEPLGLFSRIFAGLVMMFRIWTGSDERQDNVSIAEEKVDFDFHEGNGASGADDGDKASAESIMGMVGVLGLGIAAWSAINSAQMGNKLVSVGKRSNERSVKRLGTPPKIS